jgi:hypothetical protein
VSAIASFIQVSKSALGGLRGAAIPKKTWLGKRKDTYWDYLKQYGRETAQYEWSGYVFTTLLPYLEGRKIDLMHSEYDELSKYLSQTRGATTFILTEAHKQAYLSQLAPDSYSEAELRDYFNEFTESSDLEGGKPMLDGIRAIHRSLQALNANSVIVFSIG